MNAPKQHWQAVWIAQRFLQDQQQAGRSGSFPAALAKHSGMSRLEAELALRLCVAYKVAIYRRDGRFFYKDPFVKGVAA